jgi:hypothetical protein
MWPNPARRNRYESECGPHKNSHGLFLRVKRCCLCESEIPGYNQMARAELGLEYGIILSC